MRHGLRVLCLVALALAIGAMPATAADKLTLVLEWFVNPDHGPIIVAQQKGWFREAGLDVELIAPSDPNDPPKLVSAGQADIAVSYQPLLHVQVGEGLPLARIGTLIATPLNTMIVMADGPIRSIGELRGKKIGYSGTFEDGVLAAMLGKHGLKLADVEPVNVNFSLAPALITGQVDAIVGGFRNFEVTQLELEGRPGRAFYPEEEGVPAYDELIFIAHRDRLSDPRLGRFLAAVERGALWSINHPDEAFEVFKAYAPELDDELNARAWRATLPRFAQSPAALDSGRYARFAAFLAERGLIKAPPPVSSYAIDLGAR